jgi:hypothetical protein
MLCYIDEKEVFDCSNGLCPILLLDGYGSHLISNSWNILTVKKQSGMEI